MISTVFHHTMLPLHAKMSSQYLLTLICKSWKTHPEIFLKFSFSGSSHRPFYWKTHPDNFSKFQFWGVTQAVLLENSSIKNHGYLFSFFQFWGVTQTVLLENSSRQFFKSFFNFFKKTSISRGKTSKWWNLNGKGNWQVRLWCKTLTWQCFSVVWASSRIAAITKFTGSGIFIWVNIMAWLTFWTWKGSISYF